MTYAPIGGNNMLEERGWKGIQNPDVETDTIS